MGSINVNSNRIGVNKNDLAPILKNLIAGWTAKGKTNDDADKNILKDVSGHGHDITLSNFAFSGMSGYGGYTQNFKDYHDAKIEFIEHTKTKIVFINKGISQIYNYFTATESNLSKVTKSYKIKVSGLIEPLCYTYFIKYDEHNTAVVKRVNLVNGVNIIPEYTSTGKPNFQNGYTTIFFIEFDKTNIGQTITLELLPDYPDALLFDGVDDFGKSAIVDTSVTSYDNYSLIYKGKLLEDTSWGNILISLSDKLKSSYPIIQLDTAYDPKLAPKLVRILSGNNINGGTQAIGKDVFVYGQVELAKSKGSLLNLLSGEIKKANSARDTRVIDRFFNLGGIVDIAFYCAYIFNRTLTEQEIKKFVVKYIDPDYLLPSEIPAPKVYYDCSTQRDYDTNTTKLLKDLSGNNNHGTMNNFKYGAGSGFGSYGTNFELDGWQRNNAICPNYSSTNYVAEFNTITELEVDFLWLPDYKFNGIPLKLNISGLTDKMKLFISSDQNWSESIELKNGVNDILFEDNPNRDAVTFWFSAVNKETGEKLSPFSNIPIKLEVLPNYPNGLVFDGVDDNIKINNNITTGFKTMFMVVKTLVNRNQIFYDQRSTDTQQYAIMQRTANTEIAYNYYNNNGTYINNKLNNEATMKDVFNKTHLIMVKTNDINTIKNIIIGASYLGTTWMANMVFYKFLGFDKVLTDKEVNHIIDKYMLMDDVDFIDVK